MGLFQYIFGNTRKESEQIKRRKNLRNRVCKYEEVEKREMLSASPYQPPYPINFGVAYHEDYVPSDTRAEDRLGDTFVVSWNGGAAN
ncbi:MAG: hypothetical protein FWE67_05100, partial [Planctomycetaceae bacterium]|nr:hypothetical protein [Planctomycetaceae bacterium]